MSHRLATLIAASGLAGCSLLYNPDHISAIDAGEVIADADPTMLELDSVSPSVIFEGQGIGSRPAVIAISGRQIVKDQTTVAVTVHPGQAKSATLMVDNTQLDVAADGDMLAIPITVPQDDNLLATDQIRFDVTVTQNTVNGPVTRTLSAVGSDGPVLTVQGLPELRGTNATITPTDPPTLYSVVALTGTISAPANSTVPIVVRATTSISIGGVSALDASGPTPGPAGGAGGGGGAAVNVTPGAPGGGPGGGQPSGGTGKYVGNDQLTSLGVARGDKNASSGGAGGDGSLTAAGGTGGGGGGLLELTAGGDLTIGGISAKGAAGTTSTNNGGAGSGGVVLLRSGGSVKVTGGVDVSGGTGPGIAGDPGRIRIDAPSSITATTTPAAHYRGPTFVTTTPMIVRSANAMVAVINEPQRNFIYYINNADGSQSHGPITVLTPPSGMASVELDAKLFRGVNQLCAIVDGATAGTPEAGECIQIVYLYMP